MPQRRAAVFFGDFSANYPMQIRPLSLLSEAEISAILARGESASADIRLQVGQILEQVRHGGEKAVLELTSRLDKAELNTIELSREEWDSVNEKLPGYDFLREAAASIQKFHENQLQNIQAEKKVETRPGIVVWREWRAIERVGIYAPGGLATYPSSVLMQALPARIAGCKEIILATPPNKKGYIPDVTIAAAKIAGVTKIIKCGGAQAIGALAYIYKVEKITGPGNPWVTEAKAQISQIIAIDMPAGPSEILILADETAQPAWVAADLLSQAEHAADSSVVLVTTSEKIAKAVGEELEKQVQDLDRREIAEKSLRSKGQILIAETLEKAIEFTNRYAPEHLEICTQDPEAVLKQIQNAGSVFLGNYTSEPAGDFATGSNHVLPTAGFAKNFGPLSVESFGKKIQVQNVSAAGLAGIKEVCEKFGELEGLDAHAKAITIRFKEGR